MFIQLSGKEYELSATLRVPYEIQKAFGNKPYTKVFEGMSSSSLEDQIKIIYTAFKIKNPNIFTLSEFTDLLLDQWNLDYAMEVLKRIIDDLMGIEPEDAAEDEGTDEKNLEES